MFSVKTSLEAEVLLKERFADKSNCETVSLADAAGRTLFEDLASSEDVPAFRRSTVDGYALRAEDTFGCSEAMPALLRLVGEVRMGQEAKVSVRRGFCVYVPTGGQLPEGADAMVMLEFTEDFKDGTIAVSKPAAPGNHIVFRGDEVAKGDIIFRRGHRVLSKDIGSLAAMGFTRLSVFSRPRVAIISTGDELVPAEAETLSAGQIRDVNGPLLSAAVAASGGEAICLGIIADDEARLKSAVSDAVSVADIILISGGSSVGTKDLTQKLLSEMGELLFHGLALKPGKPTLAADLRGKPVFGLPGHPLAAYFIYWLFVRPLIYRMMDSEPRLRTVSAQCAVNIPSNHGREECVPIRLEGDKAVPVMGKSGLITTLAGADGYIRIPRDTEGVKQGENVQVLLFSEEL